MRDNITIGPVTPQATNRVPAALWAAMRLVGERGKGIEINRHSQLCLTFCTMKSGVS